MATITHLNFLIDSKYDGKGVTEAREDVRKFKEELARLSGRHIRVKVDAEVDPVFPADFQARLRAIAIAHDYRIPVGVEIDAAQARAQLDALTRNRGMRVDVNADTARARAELDTAARNRTSKIEADPSSIIGSFLSATRAAKYLALSIAAIGVAFFALGPIVAVIGAAMTAALGGGVIAAGIAAIAINDKLTRSHQMATAAAQMQANTASTALGDAYRNVSVTAADGAYRIAAAEHSAEAAVRSSQQARAALTLAYQDAGRSYEDMILKLKGAPIDEKVAEHAVQRARMRLMELGKGGSTFTFLDVQEAQDNIDQALGNLEEVRVRNRRLAEDVNKANQQGIDGSKQVVDAKDRLINAEEQETNAAINVGKTRADVAEANKKAQEQVTQAQAAATQAQAQLNEEIRKANGLAATAARMFAEMAAPMRGPLLTAMEDLKRTFVEMTPLIQDMFRNAVPLIKPFSDALIGFAQKLLPGVNTALKESQPIIEGFRDSLASFGGHLGNMFANMTAGAAGLGNTWRVFGDEFGRFFEIVGGAAGRMSQTGSDSLRLLMGGFNDFLQKMVDGAVPAMASMAGGTSTLNAIFGLLGDFFKEAGPGIGKFTEALSGVLQPVLQELGPAFGHAFGELVNSLVPVLKSVAPIITKMADGFADLMKNLDPIMPVLGPLIAGMWLLDAAMAANPIDIIVLALAAVAGGIYYLATKTDFFQGIWEKLQGMWENVKPIITSMEEPLRKIGDLLGSVFGDAARETVDKLKGGFQELKDQWETNIKPALQGLGEALGPLWEKLKPILGAIGAVLLAVANGMWHAFNESIRPIFKIIGDVVTFIIKAITGIVEVITGIIGTIGGFVGAIIDIGKLIVGIFTGNGEAISNAWNAIVADIQKIGDNIIGIWDGVMHILDALGEGIINLFIHVGEAIGRVVGGFVMGIIHFFEHLYDVLVGHSIVPDLINTIIDFFTYLPKKVIELVKFLVDEVIKLWQSVWDKVKTIGQTMWDIIQLAFKLFTDGVRTTLEGVVTKAEEIWNNIKGIFARPINAVIGFWNDTIADKIGLGDKKIPVIPGYADGGQPGLFRGRGGPRDDKNLIAISDQEYIVNARATAANKPMLDAMNFGGYVPGFADGGNPVDWMKGWMSGHHPSMKVTSDYRDTPDYHGQGKAVDFQSSVSEMVSTASDIASTWGKSTLELIHGNGFAHNIKNGGDVGDGMSFYKPGTMAEHNNHVHWAVDHALGEGDQGGSGIFDRIGSAIGSVVGGARNMVSGLFESLTNPLLDKIPSPFMPGMGGPMGEFPKSTATNVRDSISEFIRGREKNTSGGSGDIGGIIPDGERLKIIDEALRLTNTPPPGTLDEWRRGMNTLITRESGWNAGAQNNTDINAINGVPSKGLAQVIGPTFQANKVPGYDNINDPVSNVAASINYIKRHPDYGNITNVQQANQNMPPKGYADGTDNAAPGWNLVGENGPEMVKFRGGEEVYSFDKIIERIKGVNIQGRTSEALTAAAKTTFDTFMSDLTGGSVENGFLGNVVKEGMKYGQSLSAWNAGNKGDTHYHVGNTDEAVKLYQQNQREKAMGFMD